MSQYISGRQPFLKVGIPGITTNTSVLDITGRIGIGTTNPSADLDLSTIRIRQSITDASNSSGQLGYFLTNDASGIRWTAVPPDNNNALFVSQNGVISGVSSYTGLNFTSDGNDLVAISTNINPNIVDIKINSYWNTTGNTGIYTSKFIGIGSTNPTVALDVIGNSRISGIVTIGVGDTGVVINSTSGIVTSISGLTTLTFYGNLIGSASTASFATTAFNIDATTASKLIVGYAQTAGIATYATRAGVATNLKGNEIYSIPYQSGTDTTSFLSPNDGLYLKSNGSGSSPSWDLPIGQISVSNISNSSTYYPLFVSTTGNTSSVSIGQNLFSFIPLSSNPKLGIGTGSPNFNLDVNGTGRFIGTVSADIYYGNGFVGTALSISGISTLGTVKISSGIITSSIVGGSVTYYGDGSKLTGVSGVRVEFQDLVGIPVYPTLANNSGVSSVGIATTGNNALVFIPNSGSLGIGTTNPTSKLWVNGNGYFTGVVTSSGFYVDGDLIGQGGISGTNLVGTALSISGISTLGTVKISSGIVTSTTGTAVTFYGDFVGTASSAGYATTAFNLDATAASNLNVAYATKAGVSTDVIGGIASVSSLFVDTLGISTLGTVKISSGIITSTTGVAVTFYGDFVGTASSAGYATTAFNLDATAASNLNVSYASTAGIATYASKAGVSTDVIGGIASVSSLFVDTLGISTLGTVKISSGIVTSNIVGVSVTYYGDGSKLTGVSGVRVQFQELVGDPVYPTLANNSGVSSVGIATTGTNALVFIPNSGSLGIGTTNPTSKLWVNGDGYFVGVVTATTFNGNLTGIASTAINLAGGSQGSLPYQNSSGITSFVSVGTNNQVLLYNTDNNKPYWGEVSAASGSFPGIDVKDEDSSSVTGIKTLNFRGDNISAVSDTTSGISTITVSSNLVGTALSISGISTLGTVKISSGIVTSTTGTAVTFYGDFVGTASSAGYATTAFNLNGVVESNLNVAYASTAGIASAVKPNSVALGSDTTGDYVQSISGASNQITVTSGTGEGSTPTVGFALNPTIGGNVTVGSDLQVNRNLNVNGNITIGGTTGYILVENFRVSDADIILGFTTDSQNNEASNDTTANHGGIAIASTEGNPLVSLNIVGIETLPATYKKIMWFKAGAFAGLNTDAWLSNYAIGIGSTQFPVGTRLAAGAVQFTENDLAVVRNINATGIITANEFSGKLNATSALTQSVGFATTAINLAGGSQGSLPYQNSSGITSFVSVGTNNQVLLYNTDNNKPYWGNVSSGEGSFSGITVRDEGTTSLSNINTVDIFGSNITATSGGTGIASIRVNDNLVGTALSISGISTFTNGPVFIGSGTSTGTASQSLQVTGGAYVSGSLGIGTTNPDRKLHVQGDIKITGGIYDTNNNSGDSNRVLTANGSGGWSWQPVTSIGAISGVAINDDFSTDASRYLLFTDSTSGTVSTEYVSATKLVFNPSSGNLGIGTTVPTEKLQVNGNISINGTTSYGSVTATTATTSQIGIHSTLSTSTYRSVEYTIQATQGTNYHVTKVLSIHDGTITYNSEYGTIYNNVLVGTFDVDISGGNMRLLVTPASSSSTSYTINFITTKI